MTLTKKGYRKRIMDKILESYVSSIGAVCIEGPKGCGKTWTSLNVSNSAFLLGDPSGNFNNKYLASIDVNNAFKGDIPHLIDEWQIIPMIWDATKFKVDELNRPGCFILTGSSTPVKKGIDHSGTGRIGVFKLRTMSLYESGDSLGEISLMDLFANKIPVTECKMMDLNEIIYLTIRGGWPMLIGKNLDYIHTFLKGYIDGVIEDASSLDGRYSDKSKTARVLRSLARNESSPANMSTIVSDSLEELNDGSGEFSKKLNVSEKTVYKYLDNFHRLFLIEDQYEYSPNVKSDIRVGKLPKRHLTDPSLSIATLGLTAERLKSDLKTFGYYFEALCVRDLGIYAKADNGKIFHYRDKDGREIDAIIELADGRWGAIEIKLGGYEEIDSAAKNLINIINYWKKKELKKDPSFLCVIYGIGNLAYRREDGVLVVPIGALKD